MLAKRQTAPSSGTPSMQKRQNKEARRRKRMTTWVYSEKRALLGGKGRGK